MSPNKTQSGFAVLETLLIVVIVGIIGFVSWYVYQSRQEVDKNYNTQDSSTSAAQKEKSAALSKTYADPVGKFSVRYPSSWKLTATADTKDESTASSDAKLTSPAGTVLNVRSDWGGRGGDCQPADTDKPFAAGNQCATGEYLSSEIVPVSNIYYGDDIQNPDGTFRYVYKKTDIVLVTSRYAGPDGKSEYLIGLTQSNPQFTIKLHEPTMGFVVPLHYISVYDKAGKFHPYIYATASGTDEKFLESKDANTVKAILRTIKVNL